jgi:O-antigen biosynthesis protein WbqP
LAVEARQGLLSSSTTIKLQRIGNLSNAVMEKQNRFLKRLFDLWSSLALLLAVSPLFAVLAATVKLTSPGPVFHVSKRVGRNNDLFNMFKFRTMRTDTPQVATHLMTDPARYVTPVGRFLRKTSLDELPQLLNVIKGDMSVVGPRPALFNQDDLVALRTEKSVHQLTPGITGWAQTHGRDEIPIPVKVDLDEYYLKNRSFRLDMQILLLSVRQAFSGKNVSH